MPEKSPVGPSRGLAGLPAPALPGCQPLLKRVMTPPRRAGGLAVVSSPKGCQGYSINDCLEFAVFILALSLKLLLTADVTAKLLFFEPHS